MRSLTITMALLATSFASTQAISQVVAETYSVELNKTQIMRLPRAASAILIGNPDIADVSVHSVDTLFIVGRGYGQTNLIILDRNGETMLEKDLNVVNTLPRQGVRLFNANSRQTYSCIPNCQPSPVLGDSPGFIGSNTNSEPQLDPLAALFQAAADQNNRNDTPSALAGSSDDGSETSVSNSDGFN